MRKRKILFIHGAGNQAHPEGSGRLVAYLAKSLGGGYDVSSPDMPDPDNPRYDAWRNKIAAELGALESDTILIGHSLGGSILLKHLSEDANPRPIAALFLISTPYWGKDPEWQLEFALRDDFAQHLPPISRLFLYHSRDDKEVPVSHLGRYREKLPRATARVLDGDRHSFTDGLPELVDDIKSV